MHDLALGPDHAIGLAQHEVRIVGELERVRQHDEVDGVLGERQPVRVGDDVGRRVVVERPARRDAALREERALRQPDLQRVEAEDVGDGLVEVRLLAREQVAPERRARTTCGEASLTRWLPGPEDASMIAIIPIPAFTDNYIWLLRDGRGAVVVDPGDAAPVLA